MEIIKFYITLLAIIFVILFPTVVIPFIKRIRDKGMVKNRWNVSLNKNTNTKNKLPDYKFTCEPPSPPTETTKGKMIVRYKIKQSL